MLIINDGSKDSSVALCDRLSAENENVRVIHKENGGVSSARNLGIEKAKGKYVGFLDCDDWWEPGVFDCGLAEEMALEDSVDVYQFSYREVTCDVSLEKRNLLEDKTMLFENPGFGRYDWSMPCAFVYRRTLLWDHEVRYLKCKVGEDWPVVEMALYHAHSMKQSSRVLFTYWENYDSCVHTTNALASLKEQCKGIEQRTMYYEKYHVPVDADKETVWKTLAAPPKICAQESYSVVRTFMEETCMIILDQRPDIQFGDYLWSRVKAWNANSYRYWLVQKIKTGIPLAMKETLVRLPGIGRWVNYFYSVHHRKFTPVGK